MSDSTNESKEQEYAQFLKYLYLLWDEELAAGNISRKPTRAEEAAYAAEVKRLIWADEYDGGVQQFREILESKTGVKFTGEIF
jgi:hypothetical protein